MQSSEQVVDRIIELDGRAENIRTRARGEADAAREDAQRRIAEGKAELEKRIAGRIALIEEEASQTREREIAAVRREYKDQAEAAGRTAPEKMESVVNLVLARLNGVKKGTPG